jgi:hypothetical protein
MANKPYDATKEHTPFDRTRKTDGKGRHPNKGLSSKHPVSGKKNRYFE